MKPKVRNLQSIFILYGVKKIFSWNLRQSNSPIFLFPASQAFCKTQNACYLHKLNERKLPFKKLLLLILMLAAGVCPECSLNNVGFKMMEIVMLKYD